MGPKRIAFRCEICGKQMAALQIHAHVRTHCLDVPALADKKHVPTIKIEENHSSDPNSVNTAAATATAQQTPPSTSTSTFTTTTSGVNIEEMHQHQQYQLSQFPNGMPGYPWMPPPGMGLLGAHPGFYYPGLAQAMMPPMPMYPYNPYARMMYPQQPMPPVQTKIASYIQTQDPQNGGGDPSDSDQDISLTTGSSFEAVFKVPASTAKHHRRSAPPSVEDLTTSDLDESMPPAISEVVLGASDLSDDESSSRKRRRMSVEHAVGTSSATISSSGAPNLPSSTDQPCTSGSSIDAATTTSETVNNKENTPVAENIVQVVSHKCDMCEAQFSSTVELVSHVNSSHQVLTFACEQCGKRFSNSKSLSSHKNAAHRSKTIQRKTAETAATAVREPTQTPTKRQVAIAATRSVLKSPNVSMPKLVPAAVTPSNPKGSDGPPTLVSEVVAEPKQKATTAGSRTYSGRFSNAAGPATAAVVPTRATTRASASVSPLRVQSTRIQWAQAPERANLDNLSTKKAKQVHPCPHCERQFRDYDGLKGHIVYCQVRTSAAAAAASKVQVIDSNEAGGE